MTSQFQVFFLNPITAPRLIDSNIFMQEKLKKTFNLNKTFLGKFVADKLDDEACKAYGSLPDRLYIVHRGIVQYQGGTGPSGYKVLSY